MESEEALSGLRVLIAENEFLLAAEIERVLTGQGCTVLGPVASADAALARIAADPAPDAAVLNVDLNGEVAAAVAEALRARGVPFVLVTGYTEPPAPAFEDAPRVEKPFADGALVLAVAQVVRARGRGVDEPTSQ